MAWNFLISTDKHLHLELPKMTKASLIKGSTVQNLKSEMLLFKFEFLLAMTIRGKRFGDKTCFKIPKCTNLCISLSIYHWFVFLFDMKGLMKMGHVNILKIYLSVWTCTYLSLRLNAPL